MNMPPQPDILESFLNIPDEHLIQIAIKDWRYLNAICISLSLDLQILEESMENNIH